MIEIKKEELLKNSIDYEDYSENICNPSIEELEKAGIFQSNGCCGKCSCKSKGSCSKCTSKNVKKNS